MKRKVYRSSATLLVGSFFLFGLGGCSSVLNFSSWSPFGGQDARYFAAKKSRPDIEASYRLACAYQQKNQHQLALEQFKRVLQLDPNHAQSYNGMGISYDQLGNYSRAQGCYTAALRINPDLDYVHNNMGYSYLLQGQAAPAAASFQKAIALNKTSDRYRNNLGVAYAQMGKINMALAEFKSTEKEAAAPASAASEQAKAAEISSPHAEGQAPVFVEALTDTLPPVAPAQAKVETLPSSPPSLPIAVKPVPQAKEKTTSPTPTIEAASLKTEKTKPVPVLAAGVEAIPQAPQVANSVPVQTVAAEAIIQRTAPEKSANPVNDAPPAPKKQAKQPEKPKAEQGQDPEPPASAAPPPQPTSMAKAYSAPHQTAPAPKKEIVLVQTIPTQQMFVAHNPLVEVTNGSGGKDAANWWGNYLRHQGISVAQFSTDASSNYAKTKIFYCEGYLQEAYQLAKKIPLYQEFERVAAFEDSNAKIRVVIGRDVLRFAHKDGEKIILARAEI